jgi:glutamyl-tRNA synthetase
MANPVTVRIAPSPTGDPHVGTAYVGLFNMALRLKRDGKFILRIDDTDRSRYQAESERRILDELAWLGIRFDEGPVYQSARTDRYREAVSELIEKGAAYRCDCTKERLDEVRAGQKARKENPRYDGHCRDRDVSADADHVVRLKVPRPGSTTFKDGLRGSITIEHDQVDDQVLLKTDGFPTYHLATVVDDHDFGITHVLRAEEWISSMPKHALIYEAFGWDMPEHWHVPLLRNPDKSKISKRKNPTSITWYREQGFLPEALLNFLAKMGFTFGEDREVFSFDEFIEAFELEKLNATGPIFDLTKLEWLNGVHMRELDDGDLAKRLEPFTDTAPEQIAAMVPLVKERLKTLSDFDELTDFLRADEVTVPREELIPKKRDAEETKAVLGKARTALEQAEFAPEPLEATLRALGEEAGWKPRELFGALRWAMSGKKVTPPLMESMCVLGRETSLARLDKAIGQL